MSRSAITARAEHNAIPLAATAPTNQFAPLHSLAVLAGTLSDAARAMLTRTFRQSCWAGPLVLPAVVIVAQGAFQIDVSYMAFAVTLLIALTAWCPLWFWRREQYERPP